MVVMALMLASFFQLRRLPIELELFHLRQRGFKNKLIQRLQEEGMILQAAKELQKEGKIREGAELLEAVPTPDINTLRLYSELHVLLYLDAVVGKGDAHSSYNKLVLILERTIAACCSKLEDLTIREAELERHTNRLKLLKLVSPFPKVPHIVE